MSNICHLAMKVLVAGVAVGALGVAGLATVDPAGAATAPTHPAARPTHAAVCANAGLAVSHVDAIRSRFAAKIGKLDALEARIRVDSRPRARAVRLRELDKRIAHQVKLEAHVLNPKFLARAAKAAKVAGAQCHAAGTTTSSVSTPV